MNEQISLFPEEKENNCYVCYYFRKLQKPFERKDGAVIYGYCVKGPYDMEKGYAVFIPEGKCKDFSRQKGAKK